MLFRSGASGWYEGSGGGSIAIFWGGRFAMRGNAGLSAFFPVGTDSIERDLLGFRKIKYPPKVMIEATNIKAIKMTQNRFWPEIAKIFSYSDNFT